MPEFLEKVTATAPSNIALVKYWGKRDKELNLPLTSSFSVSLSEMNSTATIEESPTNEDIWEIYGNPNKAKRVLEAARLSTQDRRPLKISITNNFPSGAGLASSASSMAALAKALNLFLAKGEMSLDTISHWARVGSGSAVRSLHKGFVLWEAGSDDFGEDCLAHTAFEASHFPLALTVCVVDDRPKPISSTQAMEISRKTSPLYDRFHEQNADYIEKVIQAVREKNFDILTEVSEANCQAMHAVMRTSNPSIDYFQIGTNKAIECVLRMRRQGIPCFFSIDAGPNVKIFSPPEYADVVFQNCRQLKDLRKVLRDFVA